MRRRIINDRPITRARFESKRAQSQTLLADLVDEEGCETRLVSTVEQFDTVLRGEDSIAIAVLDTEGYTANLWKRCDYLNERDIRPSFSLPKPRLTSAEKPSVAAFVPSSEPVETADLRATIRGMVRRVGKARSTIDAAMDEGKTVPVH